MLLKTVSDLEAVSEDSGCRDVLERFLARSSDFYSRLPSMVETELSFTTSQLLSNQVHFTSKTHCRKVRWFVFVVSWMGQGIVLSWQCVVSSYHGVCLGEPLSSPMGGCPLVN